MKKQKYLNLGTKSLIWLFLTKNAVFGYFWDRIFFKRNYCHIWNQHAWICLKAEYREIMKMPKIETKSALLGYFWARTLIKLLWYLKSAPSNLSFCQISRKKPIFLNLDQNAWFGYFWVGIENIIVIFEISTFKLA